MSVLILTGEHDPSADAMVRALTEREVEVHRIDTAWFPRQLSVNAGLAGASWSGTLRTPHRTVDLSEVGAVWYRQPGAYEFPDELSPVERHHANMEAKYGLGGVLSTLPAMWVNHPARLADAAYKPVQLAAARRAGLDVPETLITNDADEVREFVTQGRTVTKMIGAGMLVEEGVRKVARTREVDVADVADLRGVETTTHLFQRWVEKAYEVRLIVIGCSLTAYAIHAGSPEAHIDFRADYDSLSYELVDIPQAVSTGVDRLMGELDLVYGALDFVVSPDGRWTFLEINPTGQYGWLEHHVDGVSLTGKLANLLAAGATFE